MTKRLLCVCFSLTSLALAATAAIDDVLPKPRRMELCDCGSFAKGGEVRLTDPTDCLMLREFLRESGLAHSDAAERTVTVELVEQLPGTKDYALKGFPAEGYRLNVSREAISIQALTPTGVTRAAATLLQLAEGCERVEGVDITDWPAFKLRGFMHDTGRSFVTVDELKKQIRLYARFKVNCFHWHLTENQAWRYEVKAYPQLTSAASMTRYAGQYYTQEECREIDQLCHDYGIQLIPEIDMPGHSAAFQRAMGHGMQTDAGVQELKAILTEAAGVFHHAPYIHIGADEETISYPNFLETMIAHVKSLGKHVMVWNPIRGVDVAGLQADMCQLWSTSGRKIGGKANIDCRYNYTNHFDVFADLAGIYLSQIYYQNEGDAEIAGEISCPWNDRKTPTQEDIIRQNNVWANTIASASRAWTGGGQGYIETQGAVLPNSGEQFDDFADWERRFLHWKRVWLADEPIPYVRQTNVRWRLTDMMPNGGNTATILPPEKEGPKESYLYNGQTVTTRIVTGAGIYLNHTWGTTVPCVYPGAALDNTAYAWTYVHSPVAQEAGALIEFQNYGRSEKDPAPQAGHWDRKGSRIWLNDEELVAPDWKNAGKSIDNEVDLQDENLTARPPYRVQLRQGWNKVFVKLPYAASGCRLNKWMWTFVLTDLTGKNALEGIRYSPDRVADETAEALQLFLSDIQTQVNSTVSDRIGYYKRETASELQTLLDEVRATLGDALPPAEREQQKEQVQQAYEHFLAHYREGGINLPQTSSGEQEVWYSLMSKRSSRYAISGGAGSNISGNTALSEGGYWKFTERADGTLNIMNRKGLYVSPASSNNTALKTVAAEPATGWSISQAATEGYIIITSGNVQFNQTNLNGLPVYNWGDGSNTTDEGCQYLIQEAPKLPVSEVKYSTAEHTSYYYLHTPNRGNRYPTAYGDGEEIIGQTVTSDAAAWKFVLREDGTADIINYVDGTYVSPASTYNTALRTVSHQPTKGWKIEKSGNYFIIYSGTTAQFNQTNNTTLGYKVYNWGNQGTPNTTDTGCQYLITEADVALPTPEEPGDTPGTAVNSPTPSVPLPPAYYTLDGRPAPPAPRRGLYIRREGEKRQKVLLK